MKYTIGFVLVIIVFFLFRKWYYSDPLRLALKEPFAKLKRESKIGKVEKFSNLPAAAAAIGSRKGLVYLCGPKGREVEPFVALISPKEQSFDDVCKEANLMVSEIWFWPLRHQNG